MVLNRLFQVRPSGVGGGIQTLRVNSSLAGTFWTTFGDEKGGQDFNIPTITPGMRFVGNGGMRTVPLRANWGAYLQHVCDLRILAPLGTAVSMPLLSQTTLRVFFFVFLSEWGDEKMVCASTKYFTACWCMSEEQSIHPLL